MLVEAGRNVDISKAVAEITQAWQTDSQILILCSTINQANKIAAYMRTQHNQQVLTYFAHDNRTYKTAVWKQILSGQQCIIIGTMAAGFLPFKNLSGVVVVNESDTAAKAIEARPLIHLRSLSLKLAELNKCLIAFIDNSPSVEVAYLAKKNRWRVIRLGDEIEKKNLLLMKPPLLNNPHFTELIKNELDKRKKVLIIGPRVGEAGFLQCHDCHHIFTCPSCSLAYHLMSDNTLTCNYCHRHEDAPVVCPKCQGSRLQPKQLALGSISRRLNSEFPKAAVSVFDAKSKNLPGENNKIVVATVAAIYHLPLESYSLRVIMGFDSLLQLPQIQATERAYNLLRSLLLTGKTIVETNSVEHSVFSQVNSWPSFIKNELKQKEKFELPPFRQVYKLSIDAPTKPAVENGLQQALQYLKTLRDLDISEPLSVPSRSVYRQFRRVLLIKPKNAVALDQLLKLDYSQWTLDPDPIDFE